jgi:nucleoside-diphosphate-sugar epimerase
MMLLNEVKGVCGRLSELRSRVEERKFLVTGGAGFLGSWVCDLLVMLGGRVVCVDNLISGSSSNIAHLLDKGLSFFKADVCDFSTREGFDFILHLASPASPPIYQENPIPTLDANVVGTKRMLELARAKDAKGFLLASTSEVYGNPPDNAIPTPESYWGNVSCYGPRSMYDEGKRAAEAYCYSYFKRYGLPIRIARIFNTYGPRMDVKGTKYGRVIARFICQALRNDPITVYGDGTQTRSFCYVTDLIEGLVKLLLLDGLDGEVLNLGSDQEVRIIDLANQIRDLTGSSSSITFLPLPPDDPRRRCPDLSKAGKLLGYRPRVSLVDGLRRTIEWVRSSGLQG